ncbi:helix-turn-helix domain-containing protein [Frankia sp. Cas4]|uniref:TetR/AcrR family transcriptional regulator n=1 Tax=Frankia sp. Cas4 TaxID=3073927 RepID=UPI002AD20922|nr:helix-turn-helix domain-containing protein [Frankia sp. Cas4]
MTQDSRSRRSSATVRSLVLGAARELFDEHGYEHVTTREIAARAGVTQALVFRHFGTKANLFVEAVYRPFYDFVAEYVRQWIEHGHGARSAEQTTRDFVGGLYLLLIDNHKLLLALPGGPSGGSPELRTRAGAFLQEVFDKLEREIEAEVAVLDAPVVDVALSVRFTVALVYGATVLDDMLFPAGRQHPTRARLVEEMAGFVIRGSGSDSDSGSGSDSDSDSEGQPTTPIMPIEPIMSTEPSTPRRRHQ